jgi:phage host-nuclease inhibitor protein Gam
MIDLDEIASTEAGTDVVAITSIEDAENVLNELQKAEAKLSVIDGKLNEKIAAEREKVAGTVAELEETVVKLRNSITKFAHANKDNIKFFPEGEKTMKVRAGSIQVNAGVASIDFLPGYDEETVIRLIGEQGLADTLLRTPDPELDKLAVMRGYNAKDLTPAALTGIGLKHEQTPYVKITLAKAGSYKKAKAKA